jgi:carboxypeptidase family protein
MRSISVGMCLVLAAVGAAAQSDRGTITGTVTDPAGAVVAGAPVQARNAQTGAVYQAATSNTGNYTVAQLPAGTYELTVTVQGFKKYTRQNLAIEVAQIARVDVGLEVGAASESVTVSEAAPLLATETGDLSHNIAYKYLDELPMWSNAGGLRSMYNVVQLLPGTYQAGQELRISGAPNNTQSVRVDRATIVPAERQCQSQFGLRSHQHNYAGGRGRPPRGSQHFAAQRRAGRPHYVLSGTGFLG